LGGNRGPDDEDIRLSVMGPLQSVEISALNHPTLPLIIADDKGTYPT
jgi:hypothetical protein